MTSFFINYLVGCLFRNLLHTEKPKRIELKLATYDEADRLIQLNEGWRICDNQGAVIIIGMCFIEKLEPQVDYSKIKP